MNMILHYEYVQVFLVHFNAKTFARFQLLHKYLNVCLTTVQNIFLNLSCISMYQSTGLHMSLKTLKSF